MNLFKILTLVMVLLGARESVADNPWQEPENPYAPLAVSHVGHQEFQFSGGGAVCISPQKTCQVDCGFINDGDKDCEMECDPLNYGPECDKFTGLMELTITPLAYDTCMGEVGNSTTCLTFAAPYEDKVEESYRARYLSGICNEKQEKTIAECEAECSSGGITKYGECCVTCPNSDDLDYSRICDMAHTFKEDVQGFCNTEWEPDPSLTASLETTGVTQTALKKGVCKDFEWEVDSEYSGASCHNAASSGTALALDFPALGVTLLSPLLLK